MLADAAAAERLAHAQVQDVRFACTDAHDAVGAHLPAGDHDPADVAHPPAIAKDPFTPGDLIRGALDRPHLGDFAPPHRPHPRSLPRLAPPRPPPHPSP